MKVLLANPPCKEELNSEWESYFIRAGSRWPHSSLKKKKEKPYYLPFPFYLAYTASLLRRDGYEPVVLDAVALDMSEDEFLEYVDREAPDILFFETVTPTIDNDLNLIRKIKSNNKCRIVLGGAHVSIFPRETMQKNPEVDFVIAGEYELVLHKLVKCLKENKPYSDMAGLSYRRGSEVFTNGHSPLIDPLDQLLFPAWDLFPSNSNPDIFIYWDGFCQYRKAIQVHASRGCPYKCNFCLWNQVMYNNGRYRIFSASRVVDEIEELIKKYNPKEIYFDDDDFTINKKQVLRICREIKNRGIKIKWSCMGDAINPDSEMIDEMASSGCIGMKFGVESGSPRVLEHLGKPVNLEHVREVCQLLAKHRIKSHGTFSFGLKGEDLESMKETMEYAKSLDVDTVQFSTNTPYLGTRFYDEVVKNKQIQVKDWKEFDGKCMAVVSFPGLPAEQIRKFHENAIRTWLFHKLKSPTWILRQVYNVLRAIRGQGIGSFFRLLKSVFRKVTKIDYGLPSQKL